MYVFVCVSVCGTQSIETSKGSGVVRVMWSRCLSDLSLRLFLALCLSDKDAVSACINEYSI